MGSHYAGITPGDWGSATRLVSCDDLLEEMRGLVVVRSSNFIIAFGVGLII